MTHVVPLKAAFDMLMTGRFIHAGEAHRIGFVNRVVPDGELERAAVAGIDGFLTRSTPPRQSRDSGR